MTASVGAGCTATAASCRECFKSYSERKRELIHPARIVTRGNGSTTFTAVNDSEWNIRSMQDVVVFFIYIYIYIYVLVVLDGLIH